MIFTTLQGTSVYCRVGHNFYHVECPARHLPRNDSIGQRGDVGLMSDEENLQERVRRPFLGTFGVVIKSRRGSVGRRRLLHCQPGRAILLDQMPGRG